MAKVELGLWARGSKTHRTLFYGLTKSYKSIFRRNLDTNGLFCYYLAMILKNSLSIAAILSDLADGHFKQQIEYLNGQSQVLKHEH